MRRICLFLVLLFIATSGFAQWLRLPGGDSKPWAMQIRSGQSPEGLTNDMMRFLFQADPGESMGSVEAMSLTSQTATFSVPIWSLGYRLTTSGDIPTVREYGGYEQVLFVDGNTSLAAGDQVGTAESPYATIQQALDEIGQPASAAEYQMLCVVRVAPATYTENLTVPHRAIVIEGYRVKISGNITREIGDEYEYGVSSSTWRGCLALIGNVDARDNHQAHRYGIQVTGNYRCKVEAGKTGSTTHDTYFCSTKIDGTVTADDGVVNGGAASVGTEVLYLDRVQLGGTNVEGRTFYCQRWNSVMVNVPTLTIGTFGLITECQFEDGDVWGGFSAMTISAGGYTDPPYHEAFTFQDCTFRQVTLNTTTSGKSLRIDASSYYWWRSGVTLGTNPPTVTLVEHSEGCAYDPSGTGLSSTNAQDAITELDTRTRQEWRSIDHTSEASSVDMPYTCYLVDCSGGNVSLHLPSVTTQPEMVVDLISVGAHGGNVITIDPFETESVNGSPTNTTALAAQWDAARVKNNGTAWYIWKE